MRLLDPYFYRSAHLIIISVFTLYYLVLINGKTASSLLRRKHPNTLVFIYSLLFIIIVGLRPNSAALGDTVTVVHTYDQFSHLLEPIEFARDALFYYFMWGCSRIVNVNIFFLILEFIYIVPMIIACSRFYKNNSDIGLLFCFSAFSFFTYGVNGMRNGAACSLVLLAISLIRGKTIEKVFSFLFSAVAIGFHTSTALPVICMLAAYLIKNKNIMFIVWISSIILSLAIGDIISTFFSNLGFDDRLTSYIQMGLEGGVYTRTGFRWDFLLYSAVPIIIGYIVVIKKRVFDPNYLLILGTYIYANSFWIMVIRAEYSNRFAYLSWFLYPIVLSYPFFKMRIWPKTQGGKAALVMFGHLLFTLIMVFLF